MKHRGFTLIEVLVSLAIFALAAVGLGAAYSSVLQARMALKQDEQYLDDLARTRAAMLETVSFDSLDVGGDVNLPGDRKAHWKAKAEPTTVSDLFNVTLTMAIQRETNGEFTPDITETSMLLRPTWSVVSDRQKIIDAARERLYQQRGYKETDPGPGGLVSAPTPYKNPLAGKGKGGQGGNGKGGNGTNPPGNGKGGNGPGNGQNNGTPNRGGNGQGGNGQGNGQGRGGNGGNGTPGQNGNGQGGGNRGGGVAPAPGQGGAPARAF
jgi:general secretion pathway protein I